MQDNEFYYSNSEFHDSKSEYHISDNEFDHGESVTVLSRKEVVTKNHARRRKLIQFLCSAAMIVVVSTAVITDVTHTEPIPGIIMDAKTGKGIENVTLAFHQGDTVSGMTVAHATTDEDGNFMVALPDGEYTALASATGYSTEGLHFRVDNENPTLLSGTLLPMVGIGGSDYTIVLTWGDHPSDLDSHLESDMSKVTVIDSFENPENYDSGYYGNLHVFFGCRDYYYTNNKLICNLDVDDTDYYGPETITLNTVGSQPYYYYVYNYSYTGDLYSSEATVRVYKGSKLLKTFNVPTKETSDGYWNVFAIKKGQLIISDTVTYEPDLNYAD